MSAKSRFVNPARPGGRKRVTYAQLTERSRNLPYTRPLQANLLENVASDSERGDVADLQTQVEDFADQTCPVMKI